MTRIGIIGASGYTGGELSRLLSSHPQVEITVVTSRQHEGKTMAEVFPHLRQCSDLICEAPDIDALCAKADLFFTAVPHKTAMAIVPTLLARDRKVIDLSADFRLKDVSIYERWYQQHTAPEYIDRAVYGLPEIYRKAITDASLVANPGCYPTSILLPLAPLLEDKLIETKGIIADSKSGVSGAGRAASVATLYCEVADGFRPYKVGDHRHTPEIDQELSLLAGTKLSATFTPHLLPISRGILSTLYATLKEGVTAEAIAQSYRHRYAGERFVRLVDDPALPATQYVRGSNYCDIGFRIDPRARRLIIMSAIDNVVKGAAGQAIQNMNIMCGFPEDSGLEGAPLFP